ncbi:rRNA pseudouridine synthase [Mobilitalea sibirica]|uniref:Pseudouridine synthase n=2 Tax=Mobilitalea sibirica TaxID=1462919 RepID=A0A8J7KWK2_9FIRM|nr:rRNA pseudouridine synthase [Mobilitalea sibirica]
MLKQIRLDKYLADMGIGTRSELKLWIRKGKVKVNGTICPKPEFKITIDNDEVCFDGKEIIYQKYMYYMLHKPAGVVSATIDNVNRTVLDLITDKQGKDLFPVGRLDKDTEGLLLITNDGELAHQLLAPRKHVDKTYYAKVRGEVTGEDIRAFEAGVNIGEDYITLPAKLNILKSDFVSEVELTIQEGKFHQVKRMFEAVGKEVIYLKRMSMGGISLDPKLAPGEYRLLTEKEIEHLKSNNK